MFRYDICLDNRTHCKFLQIPYIASITGTTILLKIFVQILTCTIEFTFEQYQHWQTVIRVECDIYRVKARVTRTQASDGVLDVLVEGVGRVGDGRRRQARRDRRRRRRRRHVWLPLAHPCKTPAISGINTWGRGICSPNSQCVSMAAILPAHSSPKIFDPTYYTTNLYK